MQKLFRYCFALFLSTGVFASCSQDRSDTDSSATSGETITLSLSAEVSVDNEQARALSHRLGANAKGDIVPMPEFTHNQEVEVHTIIKSNRSGAVPIAKTLKWRYDATKRTLVLKQDDGHSIAVPSFNNDSGTKWYISGLIGGVLNDTKVEFMGARVVKGVAGNAGEALGSMEVPYAFGWTELTIATDKDKEEDGVSYKYAFTPSTANVKFQPLGSLLAVKLGNKQSAGTYSITPNGFTLMSNAWYDQGSFDFSTDIPTTDPHKTLPKWTESSCAGSMYYTFADGTEPGTIAHNQMADKTYYVWVMPHEWQPMGVAQVRVMLKGTSSRPETATYKDYTNIWFTDYTTEGKAAHGKVIPGKVHPLTAKASRRVALPIEYVAEYNLAGGEGLTDIATNVSPLPSGMQGNLRLAYSHRNDQSGYYNKYKVVGVRDDTYNSQGKNLQTEVDKTFGADKYYIPTHDQWWGVFLPFHKMWWDEEELPRYMDYMRVGLGADNFRQSYLSEFSKSFSQNNSTRDAVIYAIRFKSRVGSSCVPYRDPYWGLEAAEVYTHIYPSAPDNSMKCAYRFRRVGGLSSWESSAGGTDNGNMTNQLIIDVVHLGEETSPTELSAISNDSWWATKLSERKVISRTFSAPGYVGLDQSNVSSLLYRGKAAYYGSSSSNESGMWSVSINGMELSMGYAGYSNAVRLFTRRD